MYVYASICMYYTYTCIYVYIYIYICIDVVTLCLVIQGKAHQMYAFCAMGSYARIVPTEDLCVLKALLDICSGNQLLHNLFWASRSWD